MSPDCLPVAQMFWTERSAAPVVLIIKRAVRGVRSSESVAFVSPACMWRASASWPAWIIANHGAMVMVASSARAAIGLRRRRSDRGPSLTSLAEHLG